MVQHEIDPGTRGQGSELLEQFERLEEEMPGAVRPGRLEREEPAAVAEEFQPVLADDRTQEIAAFRNASRCASTMRYSTPRSASRG